MNSAIQLIAACVALLGGWAQQAEAGTLFDGQTVGYQYLLFSKLTVLEVNGTPVDLDLLVGPGVELDRLIPEGDAGDVYVSLDISDTNILLDAFDENVFGWGGDGPEPFNGIRIFDKYDVLPAFTSVTINPATNFLFGFEPSDVSFDENNIYVDLRLSGYDAESLISLDVGFATVGVPEPTSLALVAGGLVAVGMARWRRRSHAAMVG